MLKLKSNIIPHKITQSGNRPMIIQHTRSISRKKFKKIIRCLSVGSNEDGNFIVVGSQDNNLYILKPDFNEIIQKIEFSHWVRCTATGDLNNDGNSEIVVGSGDRMLHLFKFNGKEYVEDSTTLFNDFVNSCAISDVTPEKGMEIVVGSWDNRVSLFKWKNSKIEKIWNRTYSKKIQKVFVADTNWDSKKEVIVLFKQGGMEVLQGIDGVKLWDFQTERDLIAVDVGILSSEGYPITVVGGYEKILYFFDIKGKLIFQKQIEDSITALLIDDIDGDGINEVVLGEGSKYLKTFELKDPTIYSLKLRWSHRIHGVINSIKFTNITLDDKKEIIYGGYDCCLTALGDNYYGLESSFSFPVPNYIKKQPKAEFDVEREQILTTGQESLFQGDNETLKIKKAVESGSENDEYILQKGDFFHYKSQLFSQFTANGLNKSQAEQYYDYLKKNDFIIYQRTTPRGYHVLKHSKINKYLKKDKKKAIKSSTSFIDQSYVILEKIGYFQKKEILEKSLRDNGIPNNEVKPTIDYFKSKKLLIYSRKTPRGYHFKNIGEKEIEVDSIIKDYLIEIENQIKEMFKIQPLYPTKKSYFDAIEKEINLKHGFTVEKIFEHCKNLSIVKYSRSKPRGYSLK